jgi:NAD(P)-dependent dehydrogenase (short-subunit alcohol dehydrogenase family)
MMARKPRIELDGAVALVTGAGSGIGRVTALALSAAGASVICTDIDGDAAAKTAAGCDERGGADATSRQVDVADRAAMQALADEVQRDHGALGVMVNNAGVGLSGRFTDMSADDWHWIRSINLDGVVNGCAVFAPAMLAAGRGHVVNVASALGYTPTGTEAAYVTTKAGVLALSQCLRADWAKQGVGVSAICPGVINTAIVEKGRLVGDRGTSTSRRRIERAFRHGHRPEKVADAILSALRGDRPVVPVGFEAWAGWAFHRLGPVPAQQLLARIGMP